MTLILILLATLYALGVFAAAVKGWMDWDFADNRKESRQAARTFLLSLVWPILAIETGLAHSLGIPVKPVNKWAPAERDQE